MRILLFILFIGLADIAVCQMDTFKIKNNFTPKQKKIKPHYQDTISPKNYFSINGLSLLNGEFRFSYEYFILKRQSIQLTFAYKPSPSKNSRDIYLMKDITKNDSKIAISKYISVTYNYYPKHNLIRKKYFYLSCELYYLDKMYNNKYYTYIDSFGIFLKPFGERTFIESEHKKIGGLKLLPSFKFIKVKSKKRLILFYEIYLGMGVRFIDNKLIQYGEVFYNTETYFPEPKVKHSNYFEQTLNLGLKIGIAWRGN